MLKEQYRMHAEIRAFPSAHFYNNEIVDAEAIKVRRGGVLSSRAGVLTFFDLAFSKEVQYSSNEKSKCNPKEGIFVW